MMRVSTVWSKAALALGAAVLAVNVYRAATLSITTDEAYTYNRFVDAPGREGVLFYDANNHVLHTLAVRVTAGLFGASELTVRLPALAGGALYVAAAWLLCGYVFGPTAFSLLCLAMLTVNPFVWDYLSVARGYGMALGFLMLAIERMVRYTAEGGAGRLYTAGLSLGLAVASNLVFSVPATALAVAFAAVVLSTRGHTPFWTLVDRFAIPALVAAFAILAVPLSHMERKAFYYGTGSVAEMVSSVVRPSLMPPGAGFRGDWAAGYVLRFMPAVHALAALLAAAGLTAFWRALRARGKPPPRSALAAVAGGGIVIALAILVAAHHAAGLLYPLDRTAVYWPPLAVLAAFAMARNRAVLAGVSALALAALLQFTLLFRVDYYGGWRFDAGTRKVVSALRAREHGTRRVRLGASWELETGLNFYRRIYSLTWLEPVQRDSLDKPADYRVLAARDADKVAQLHLQVLYRDPVSGTLLAR